ncbi:hypothetical protein DSL72_007369 [Monilinia vaccinii-corymbosi]|uniref:Uncharacterized protein n=1 Tax=Monilinia vaccinii-corymbosi TaxID=61207 RepID=A0A8A3PMM4_9HELO|nr:hypothetical protein DSL72_007369 [Monilinia vaccinii-corymbosi]
MLFAEQVIVILNIDSEKTLIPIVDTTFLDTM